MPTGKPPLRLLPAALTSFSREVGGSNPDVVISVPAYYTDAQRRQMLHAADIAGLKVLPCLHMLFFFFHAPALLPLSLYILT
jgi:hypothetical protein